MLQILKRKFLLVVGSVAVLLGLMVILLGVTVVRSLVQTMADRTAERLELGGDMIAFAQQHFEVLESSLGAIDASLQMVETLPETLLSTHQLLDASALTLERTGITLDALTGGIQDLVIPDDEIETNADLAKATGAELREVAAQIRKLRERSEPLEEGSSALAEGLSRVSEELPAIRAQLDRLGVEIRGSAETLRRTPWIGWLAALMMAFAGGLYLLLGGIFLGLAQVDAARPARTEKSERTQTEEFSQAA